MHIAGAVFYVTSRGDNNENIFKDETDYSAYLELLNKYKEQYGFKLFSFCLMPNHLHLLLELKENLTVSQITHDLHSNYTKYFNSKYARKGHLFQERYKMVIAEKETQLLWLAAYIHLNPYASGLVNKIGEYRYSSYLYYVKGCTTDQEPRTTVGIKMEEEVKEMRSRLSELGIADYASYLEKIPRAQMEALGKDLGKKLILGSADFMAQVEKFIEQAEQAAANSSGGAKAIFSGRHKFLHTSLAVVVILALFNLYLFASSLVLKRNFQKQLTLKNSELTARLQEERKEVVKDLEEKHAADMVSYQAMAKRMELEKQKAAELEQEVQKLKEQAPKAKTVKGAQK
jgi:REP element-mobilizing transposase RayT